MKTLRLITLTALSLVLPAAAFAQAFPFSNPQNLAKTAVSNPTALATKGQDSLTGGLITSQNSALASTGMSGADTRALTSVGSANFGTKVQTAVTNDASSSAKGALKDMGLSGSNAGALTGAISNPGNIGNSLQNSLSSTGQTTMNATMKDIGGGYNLTSLGTIVPQGSMNPVAMVNGSGNIVSATQNKLDDKMQAQLNRLMNGVSLPAGLGADDRTPVNFVQKNTYAAATENPDVYYGSGNGNVGFGSNAVGSLASAVVSASTGGGIGSLTNSATSALNSGVHALTGSNQIVNSAGVVVANFNPTTSQFTSPSGALIAQGSSEYNSYKSALTSAGTNTASLTNSIGNNIQ